jgi:hypothetical protein
VSGGVRRAHPRIDAEAVPRDASCFAEGIKALG